MIKKGIFAVGFMFLAATCFGQEKTETVEERAAKKTEHMAIELNLTDLQKEQVQNLFVGIMTKNDAVKNDPNMTEEQKKEQYKMIKESKEAQLKTILTEEQYKKHQEHHRHKKMEKKPIEMHEMRKDVAPKEKSVD